MTSILWEKLGLHTPPVAGLEPHGGEVRLLSSRPGHNKHSLIWPQSSLLGQYSRLPPHTQFHTQWLGRPRPSSTSPTEQGLTSFVQPALLHNGYVVHGIRGPQRPG